MISAPQFFRALADRTRLRIVNLLSHGSLCVCDIQRLLEQPQSSVSRHLALLKSAGLIRDRRDGMRTFYALTVWDSRLARAVLTAIRATSAATPTTGLTSTNCCGCGRRASATRNRSLARGRSNPGRAARRRSLAK